MIDAVSFEAPAPGPRLLLLGGVHGDENPGILALSWLLEQCHDGRIRLLRGKVTVVARANAAAAKRGLHFVEENLNRVMGGRESSATHERRLARQLRSLIETADAVLDLHGTQAPSRPFVFLDDPSPAVRDWAQALGADYLLTGWPALYAGANTLTTTEFAQSLGKPALTVEAGQNDDPSSAAFALNAARRTLAHFGLTADAHPVAKPKTLRMKSVVRREGDGRFVRDWKNFDPVKAGEALARYADGETLTAPHDGFIIMPFSGAAPGEEWYYLAD